MAGTFVEAAKRSIRKWPRGEGGGMLLKGTPIDRPGADWLAGEIRRRDIAVQERRSWLGAEGRGLHGPQTCGA